VGAKLKRKHKNLGARVVRVHPVAILHQFFPIAEANSLQCPNPTNNLNVNAPMNPNKALWEKGDFRAISTPSQARRRSPRPITQQETMNERVM
jgi:hypothetical protein